MSYPVSIISLTNPKGTDKLSSPPHATQHSNVNDETESIETELGVTPKGSYSSVAERLTTQAYAGAVKIVRASDAIDPTSADYVCDGTADDVQINAAIEEVGDGGGGVVKLT